jgi:phospholipase/carboxylesterase
VLLLLHGTGGNERKIAELAEHLDPRATILAPRGRVSEHGSTRWFRRLSEGVFDVDDVVARAAELAEFLSAAITRYSLDGRRVIAVGFSNGANMAAAVVMRHPDIVSSFIGFSGMYPFADREPGTDVSRVSALLLNGRADAMAPTASVDRLESVLRAGGAAVTRVTRDGGHGITATELAQAREFL